MSSGLGPLLARAVEPQSDLSTARIVYAVGDPFSGRTRLELDGSGAFALESDVAEDRRPRSFAGPFESRRVRALLERLAQLPLDDIDHIRKRAPGEPESRIELTFDGESASVSLWVSEVASVPAFQAATDELLALIRELSGGSVLEPGR